jgi:hypothetical protein
VLLFRPLELLAFRAPEYEMDDTAASCAGGSSAESLVDRRGRSGDGYLEIDVERRPAKADGQGGWARVHVEVEIANFYPAIASAAGRWLYTVTQVAHPRPRLLRLPASLARLDLAESKVGRFRLRSTTCPTRRSRRPRAPTARTAVRARASAVRARRRSAQLLAVVASP